MLRRGLVNGPSRNLVFSRTSSDSVASTQVQHRARPRCDRADMASGMSNTFVIPDIHGRFDLLEAGLAEIAARSKGDGNTIVTIGDYVDKGPASRAVIDRLRLGVAGFELVTLKGNHNAMMVEALRDDSGLTDWLGKGGEATHATKNNKHTNVPQSHIDWLDGLR